MPYVYHGGSISGYHSIIVLYPEQKLGVFVSTTSDLNRVMDIALVIELWLVDYTLGNKLNYFIFSFSAKINSGLTPWLNMREACSVYPEKWFADYHPFPPLAPFTLICEMPQQSDVEPFLGNYEHPFYGRVSITYGENHLKWAFGIYGRGSLCRTQPPLTEADSFRLQWDKYSTYGSQNEELRTHENYNLIHFKRNSNGQVVKLEFVWIDPETRPEFNKIL